MNKKFSREELLKIIAEWEEYDHTATDISKWKPNPTEAGRKREEERNTHYYEGTYKGHEVEINIIMIENEKYVSISREFILNGQQSNLYKLKNLLKTRGNNEK